VVMARLKPPDMPGRNWLEDPVRQIGATASWKRLEGEDPVLSEGRSERRLMIGT
jgi:hypothetical protein